MDRPDLDAYFQRIGYTTGPRTPTLETLRLLQARHVQAIPFENLDPFCGRPVELDLRSLERKLVHSSRGGYCYEQNLLFSHALRALGFQVKGLAARVLWNAAHGMVRPRTHMLLLVWIDAERYISDVGFGGMTPTGPLRLVTDIEQPTPHEPFRLVEQDGDFVLQTQLRDMWKPLYSFDLQEQHQADYEVSSWYLSNHPQSAFVTNLMAARALPGKRYALANKTFTVHEVGGKSAQQILSTVAEVRGVLEGEFGLRLPTSEDERCLEKLK